MASGLGGEAADLRRGCPRTTTTRATALTLVPAEPGLGGGPARRRARTCSRTWRSHARTTPEYRPIRREAVLALASAEMTPEVVAALEAAALRGDSEVRAVAAQALGRRAPDGPRRWPSGSCPTG